MKSSEVYTGYTHGRWTVLGSGTREFRNDAPTGGVFFPVRCACGTEKSLRFNGGFHSESCGCLQREVAARLKTIHGATRSGGRETSGKKTRLYRIWSGMKARCLNPTRKSYADYGARGIYVDARWISDFAAFQAWSLASGYAADLVIDREDNDGPYSPANCRWVTYKTNLNNTRSNRMLSAFGETKTMSQWIDDPRCSVSHAAFQARIRLNWDTEDALALPKGSRNPNRRRIRD